MQELIYRQGEKGKRKGIITSLIIILLSILTLFLSVLNKSIFMLVFFAVLLIFGIYFIYKNMQNLPSVVVNQNGITSKINGMGLIKWEFIEGFEIRKPVSSTEFINTEVLIVKINNNEKLLQEMNSASKFMMKSNIRKVGNPVLIPKLAFDKPLEVIIQELESYKKNL